jgi:hypothetical protein
MKQVMDQVLMETDAAGSTLLLVKQRRVAEHAEP